MGAKLRFVLSMLIFGSIGIFVQYIPLPSGFTALARGVVGVAFLLLVAFMQKRHFALKAILQNAVPLLVAGIALAADWIFLFEAYKHTTVSAATLSYYFAPVFVALFSPLLLKEKITMKKVLCIAVALAGMVLVSGVLAPQSGAAGLAGIGFGLLAALAYAALTLTNKFTKGIDSFTSTIIQFSVASILLLPYVLLAEPANLAMLDGGVLLLLIVLGIVHTGVAFFLFFSGVQGLKAQTVAALSYIDPLTALVLSALLLQEKMAPAQIAGAILILCSTLVGALPEKTRVKTG